MSTFWLVKKQNTLIGPVATSGFRPKEEGEIFPWPKDAEDVRDLKLETVTDEFGQEIQQVVIDEELRAARIAEDALAADESKTRQMRQQRDALLAQCDWTQLPDSPLSEAKKSEWQTYRQALRDLPANITDIDNIVWPTKPE